MKINPYLAIIIAVTIGSFSGVLIKWFNLSSISASFFRLFIPTILLWLFLRWYQKKKIFHGNYKLMLAASALNALRIFLMFLAFTYTTVTNGVIAIYTWPIFCSVFGFLLLREKARAREWVFILLAFTGVAIMLSAEKLSFSNSDLLGIIFMLTSAALYALTLVIFKKKFEEYSSVETIFYQNLVGAIIFLPLFFIFWDNNISLGSSLVSMPYFGLVIGIVVFVLIFPALKRLKVLPFSLMHYWEVIVGVGSGVLFLGEKIYWNTVVGGIVIISMGILLIISKQKERCGTDSENRQRRPD